ncbi:DUF1801 domain-containing protein [Mucilaginibacter sp. FT3.2]|uniref:DUF1801 domain-containing protein n=1 Tax=Mucilaginibacter sp. FT3.2 TaxID=2723090 RepID=UPI00161620A0|nr:DUF1801 domain-containing protein [Mucilaginibacter sp. FT3.2]MBB6230040.1 hypothetical protein [Mucilaginibacter sp. FT3.2]
MLTELDSFYLQQHEPSKSFFCALRELILKHDTNITHAWKYNMPFFLYKGKIFCYIWTHKKLQQPFIGFNEGKRMEHPNLIFENRSRIKIMILDAQKELSVNVIEEVLDIAIALVKHDL